METVIGLFNAAVIVVAGGLVITFLFWGAKLTFDRLFPNFCLYNLAEKARKYLHKDNKFVSKYVTSYYDEQARHVKYQETLLKKPSIAEEDKVDAFDLFEQFLIDNGVFEEFFAEVSKQKDHLSQVWGEWIYPLNRNLIYSFSWKESQKGFEYWSHLDGQWVRICDQKDIL